MSRLKYVRHCLCNALYVYCRGRAVTNVGKTCGPTPCFVLAINTFKLTVIRSRLIWISTVCKCVSEFTWCPKFHDFTHIDSNKSEVLPNVMFREYDLFATRCSYILIKYCLHKT